MHILQQGFDGAAFLHDVAHAQHRLLMLDYDGTLAPFRTERHEAVPYPGVRQLLQAILASATTRLVIISGRAIMDLVPLLDIQPLPEIWGCHGWERRHPDGHYLPPVFDAQRQQGLAEARAMLAAAGFWPSCEDKPAGISLHWRGKDQATITDREAYVRHTLMPHAATYGLNVKHFNGGVELSVPGKTKADAVRAVLAEQSEPYVAAYLGDDVTDEDAFAALAGQGVSVLVCSDDTVRPTRAMMRLKPPDELLEFLQHWRDRL